MVEQLLTPQFWHDQWAVIGNAPWLVIPSLLIALLIGWLFRKIVDDGELRGYRAQKDAAEERLQLAHDRVEELARQVSGLEEKIADQDRIISDLRNTPAIKQAGRVLQSRLDRLSNSNNEIKTAATEISTSTADLEKIWVKWNLKSDKPKA